MDVEIEIRKEGFMTRPFDFISKTATTDIDLQDSIMRYRNSGLLQRKVEGIPCFSMLFGCG
jgi:hypothetical protein